MDVRSLVGPVPHQLRIGPDGAQASYELADDVVARHGVAPGPAAVMGLEGERISVEPLAAVEPRQLEQGAIGPVYRQAGGGGLAVPSGRVFVRFAEGDPAAGHEQELAEAGYRLEEVPSYAPHAAWLRPAGGKVADALSRLGRVERLRTVEHVEPQLLRSAARRD
jgi:hypothetical protein